MKRFVLCAAAALVLTSCGGDGAPGELIQACRDRIRSQASHPSTVDFILAAQSSDKAGAKGGYRVRLGFTAKNTFGLSLRHDAVCLFAPNGGSRIVEAGAWEKGR